MIPVVPVKERRIRCSVLHIIATPQIVMKLGWVVLIIALLINAAIQVVVAKKKADLNVVQTITAMLLIVKLSEWETRNIVRHINAVIQVAAIKGKVILFTAPRTIVTILDAVTIE